MMTDASSQWNEQEVAELRKVFYAQAYEIVEELQDSMLRLEVDPGNDDVLKLVKRHVHTLKGDSNSIGLVSIGTLCHRMEDVLTSLMNNNRDMEHEAIEILMSCVDAVYDLLAKSEAGREVGPAHEIIGRIGRFLSNAAPTPAAVVRPALSEYQELQIQEAVKNGQRVYVINVGFDPRCKEKSVAALMVMRNLGNAGSIISSVPDPKNSDLNEAQTVTLFLSSKLDAEAVKKEALIAGMTAEILVREWEERVQREGPAPKQPAPSAMSSRNETLRIEASRVDLVMDLVGELIIGRSMIEQITREIAAGASAGDVAARLAAVNASMERTVSDMQKGVMKMRMVPMYHVFRKFPKIVRDLSTEKGKRVRLELIGNETELDKGIVDALGEPLSHIIRNFIDHGVEAPEERRRAGKQEEGVITLRAFHEASQIIIEAGDDGRGIDSAKLRQKAIDGGFLNKQDADRMSDAEAVNLIFLSGLSTADTVSTTSGRGVGMDAVKTAVEGLKGTIEIDTKAGRSTIFRIRLPLTLAVIKALLFDVAGRLYAVPVPAISEVAKVMTDDLVTVDGKKTLLLRDQIISIISLEDLFTVGASGTKKKFVLILSMGARKVGLLIDQVMWQQELVIKAIDDNHMQS
ncbi:MAG TPA: chemotaxis protein CheA, partial [Nitrospirota bacterium]|nr:chemotaxis protein CheA [Nitrospirota bacterium]